MMWWQQQQWCAPRVMIGSEPWGGMHVQTGDEMKAALCQCQRAFYCIGGHKTGPECEHFARHLQADVLQMLITIHTNHSNTRHCCRPLPLLTRLASL
jgi:hypothetical protein